MVSVENVSFRVGKTVLLKPLTAGFGEGQFHVIMGANGAGKSTLLKILSGELAPFSGTVWLEGRPLSHYTKKALALKRAVLSQHNHLAFPITVEDVVMMGRYPFFGERPSAADHRICLETMDLLDVRQHARRDYTTLSGGEAQKVQMSRVLAQIWTEAESQKRLLLLDEPVSHLDVKYQYQLLRIAKELCGSGVTVIAVLHEINLALAFADSIHFMKGGEVLHRLASAAQISPQIIDDTFGVTARIWRDESLPRPVVIF